MRGDNPAPAAFLPIIATLMVGTRSSGAEPGTQSDLKDVNSGEKKGRVIIADSMERDLAQK